MIEPLVSVILPVYNASRWIETTLKSLMTQSGNFEVICVDDGSKDDSFEKIRRLAELDGRIFAVRLKKNVGAYQVRNWAAARARGEWLMFQDADDISHANRLKLQYDFLQSTGQAACYVYAHQFCNARRTPWAAHVPIQRTLGQSHTLAFYRDFESTRQNSPIHEIVRQLPPRPWQDFGECLNHPDSPESLAMYASLFIRKATFIDLGGFDAHTRVGADRTFAIRMLRFHDVCNLPAVLYSRRIHQGSLTLAPETGLLSTCRQAYFESFAHRESDICTVIGSGDSARIRMACRSDFYHADVRVADTQSKFELPT